MNSENSMIEKEEGTPNIHDLRIILRHFRAKEVGKTKNPNGTWHRITVGENIFETKAGMILEEDWIKLAEQAVIDNHDEKLLEAITEHVRNNCAWLRKEKEVRIHALECLASESYKAWIERGDMEPVTLT